MYNASTYQDDPQALVNDLTGQIMFSLHAAPSLHYGIALGFPHVESVSDAIGLWVEAYLPHYASTPPPTDAAFFSLVGDMRNAIHQTISEFYDGQSWQRVPEYPED